MRMTKKIFFKTWLYIQRFLHVILPNRQFDYATYWENRYRLGGNSGDGSYGSNARWKAELINSIYSANSLKSVVEFGCGDGAQLSDYKFSSYLGLDISPKAVDLCRSKFESDKSKNFSVITPHASHKIKKADLVICIEVLMHVTNEEDFIWTLSRIFESAADFVIILNPLGGPDVKRRSIHEEPRNLFLYLIPYLKDFSIEQIIVHPSVSIEERRAGIIGDMSSDFVVMRRRKK